MAHALYIDKFREKGKPMKDTKPIDNKFNPNEYRLQTITTNKATYLPDQAIALAFEDCLGLASYGCPAYVGTVNGREISINLNRGTC